MPTAVRRLLGQLAGGPSGVRLQSLSRRSSASSPRPVNKGASGSRVVVMRARADPGYTRRRGRAELEPSVRVHTTAGAVDIARMLAHARQNELSEEMDRMAESNI